MYDVIVVGARCAGAATAILLARRGHRVLLLDRAMLPSDTLCTHHLPAPAVALLARWDLLGPVAGSCVMADRTLVRAGGRSVEVRHPVVDGTDLSCAPRRSHLDAVLVDAARAAGAVVHHEMTVRDLVWDADRVVGVVVQGSDGHSVCKTARVVIGADGRGSPVARIVGARTMQELPATTCCYYAYWAGLGATRPEWHFSGDNAVGVIPTDGDLAAVVARAPVQEWTRFKRDPEGFYLSVVDRVPGLPDRLAGARRESRFFGTADLGGVVRQPSGRGWVLVGDAGHHDDPLLWSGITAAFTDAELVAAALDEGLSGRVPLDRSLEAHGRRRDAVWGPARTAINRMRATSQDGASWPALLNDIEVVMADPVRKLLASSPRP